MDLGQFANMTRSRDVMVRAAKKMQDGTLGQPGEPEGPEDPVNIRVGDETNHYYPADPAQPKKQKSSWPKTAALVVAAALAGGAIPAGILAWQAILVLATPGLLAILA